MGSNNPFVEQNNNPFMQRVDAQPSYGPPTHAWALGHAAGFSTPMPGHEGLPPDFDLPVFPRPMQTPFTSAAGSQQLPIFASGGSSRSTTTTTTSSGASTTTHPHGSSSIPPSPHHDWAGADARDPRAMPKRMRPHSPTLRSHPDLSRRGDGIRKKNARFDIPAERNLTNIDQLIAQSHDEQEIKELKQQKRLLRNRQAAYVSPPLPRWPRRAAPTRTGPTR